jgi:hypothetical protein
LHLKVECDNCITIEENYSYTLFKSGSLADSEMLISSDSFSRISLVFSFLYYVSNSSSLLPESESLYLLYQETGMKNDTVTEITKEQFESDLP